MQIEIVNYHSPLYQQSLVLRNEILRKPLGQDLMQEDLSDEEKQFHFLALEKGRLIGCVVMVPHYQKDIAKLRQMAVAELYRGRGIGKKLVKAAEQWTLEQGMHSIHLHARIVALDFYRKLAYQIISDQFEEVGIIHYKMGKRLI